MKISLKTHRMVLSPRVRSYTEARVRSALKRRAPDVESVRVWLVDSRAGTEDQEAQCRILVKTVGARPVMADATGDRFATAVDAASRRARRSLDQIPELTYKVAS